MSRERVPPAVRFADFDRAHPEVYRELARRARELRKRGFKRWRINNLFEQLRTSYALAAGPDGEILQGLNNDYRSFYARKLMEQEPDLAGFFVLRKQRSAAG